MIIKILLISLFLGLFVLFLSHLVTGLYARNQIYPISDVQSKRIAIVFGAGLWRDGSPTPILRDRVMTAVDLYLSGKVEKILMSGDNRVVNYNEPAAMLNYAVQLGVPPEVIVLDYAGRRTYDTCYRARHIFGLESAILVTQAFHMPRAVYSCNQLGVNAVGVIANNQTYRRSSLFYWNIREVLATVTALWDVHISHPVPVLGDSEPIFDQ